MTDSASPDAASASPNRKGTFPRLINPFRNLFRACGMAFKYRWSLLLSALCSIGVAFMWGANIGAVYPFVEVVLAGKSTHEWIDERIESSTQKLTDLDAQRAALATQLSQLETAGQGSSDESQQLRTRIAKLENDRPGVAAQHSWSLWAQPIIHRWLPSGPFSTLVFMVVFLVVGTILKGALLVANMVLVARVGQRTILDLQNLFFRRTLDLDLGTLGTSGTGDLVGRIRGETGAIGNAVMTLYGKLLREPLKMVACLTGAALINWRLLLLSVIICPFASYIMIRLAQSSKRANKRSMEESAKLMNRLFQALTYIKVVKAFTMEKHERARFKHTANDVYKRGMKIAFYGALARLNNEVLGIGIICLSLLAGGWLVLREETQLFGITMCDTAMTAGQLLTFYAFLIGAADPIRKMGDVYNLMQTGVVAADRVFPMLDRESRVPSPKKPVAIPKQTAVLEFQDVRFSYDTGGEVLKGLTFRLEPGTALAIVGANGCGKSTLVNLLPRFYDPTAGTITLDGTAINQFRLKDLRRYVGYVTQQTMVFDDSIMENIRYGNPNRTDEEVIEAAKRAHAHTFITTQLEDGYATRVGEHGGRLSGGQRQRIAMARAILRDPKLLILDEATSQIDPESEMAIHRALAEFIRGRTTIMITHRLSTLDLADTIMVMEEGRIVDLGSHQQLMQRCDAYRRLRQTELREVG